MKKQIIIMLLILSFSAIIAENPLEIAVPEGKSALLVLEYFPATYVSELMTNNPEIQSVSISEYGQTFGYLNTLGGIGTNFLIEPNKNYEIYTNQSITIKLKY